ncbi:adenosylcobinamide-GDP ribazoletransferase [Cognatishimia sp. WU-CL00825]|uniref:adenosylcobinamide-GDP ribazoletransferase n=1 Tax=Cognatishimia sp. WU-CL00825 TaxID=3127658 RepID=UPI003109D4B6
MQKDDTSLARPGDILTAIALLTRLPVKAEFARSANAVWAYPLAGLAVALIAGILTGGALWLNIATPLVAGIWLVTTILLTGAMHEDGLADCCDGFWGGWTTERRLEIMKDSQIGTYGVLALCLSIGFRWLAIWLILETSHWFWPLLVVEVLSRSFMPALMHALPHARDTGLSHAQGRPPLGAVGLGLGLALGFALLCLGWAGLKLGLIATLISFGTAWLAQRKIGGQTGDVLGATQQVILITLLLSLA